MVLIGADRLSDGANFFPIIIMLEVKDGNFIASPSGK